MIDQRIKLDKYFSSNTNLKNQYLSFFFEESIKLNQIFLIFLKIKSSFILLVKWSKTPNL